MLSVKKYITGSQIQKGGSLRLTIIIFLLGLVIGSLLNLFIYRIPRKIPFFKSINNHTNERNSKLYSSSFFVIITTILIFMISYWQIGFNHLLLKALVFDAILITISFIDLEHRIIPNQIIIFTLMVGIIFSFIDNITLVSALGGMITGGGILFLLALLVPKGMGGGDIKFMFAIGLFLGLNRVVVGLYLSFVVAAIVSLILLLLRLKKGKDHIPFGPFLAFGSFIAYHYYDLILSYYYMLN